MLTDDWRVTIYNTRLLLATFLQASKKRRHVLLL